MCIYLLEYLLQSENTSKLYSSLHTKQKNSSLDFYYFKLGSIFLQ